MRIVPVTEAGEPLLDPDIIWNGVCGDLAVSAPDDPHNPAGLQSKQALLTAVIICLMTDVRADATELRDGDENRGWPGDGFDLEPGEVSLGSRLWLLRRRALTDNIEQMAEDYTRMALQTLIDQRAFTRFDVAARTDRPANRLDLIIQGYGRDGAMSFDQKFNVLWEQI